MTTYSKGKVALGVCDRSGFEYPLKDLIEEYENGKPTGLLIGRDYVDPDHPQLRLGEVDAADRQTLRNPRPEFADLIASRGLYSWNPVGMVGLESISMTGKVGKVKVVIS